jgi:hypothetical protein
MWVASESAIPVGGEIRRASMTKPAYGATLGNRVPRTDGQSAVDRPSTKSDSVVTFQLWPVSLGESNSP